MTGQVVRLMIPDPSCSVPIERVPLREGTETEPGSGCTIEIEASLAMQALFLGESRRSVLGRGDGYDSKEAPK